MKLILIKDMEKVGNAGDVINVKDGYGRNFLIPRGLAVEAGRRNVKFLKNEQNKLKLKQEKLKEEARKLAEKLQNISCTITMATGEEDKIYGEVTAEMISNFYRQEGIDIDKRKVRIDKAIRHLGVYQAEIKLHPDVIAGVKIWVVKK